MGYTPFFANTEDGIINLGQVKGAFARGRDSVKPQSLHALKNSPKQLPETSPRQGYADDQFVLLFSWCNSLHHKFSF